MTDPIEVMAKELEIWALSYRRSGYGRVAREQLAALAAAGFKVLPQEPVDGMIHAGDDARDHLDNRPHPFIINNAAHIWRAMWDAA